MWTNGTNWTGGGLPTTGTHSVFFTGSTRLSGTVNSTYTLDTLQFNPTAAGSFMINGFGGSTINMRGDIVNQSGRLQTIGGTANATRVNINYGSGSGSRLIDVGTGTIALNAIIASSPGIRLVKQGAGVLRFGVADGNSQAFTGTLTLTQGATHLAAGLPGTVEVASGAFVKLNSTQATNFSIGSLSSSGTTEVGGNVYVNRPTAFGPGGTLMFSTLPNDEVSRMTCLSTVTLGGTLFVDVTKPYVDATVESPQSFGLFEFAGEPATSGGFTSVMARYDGSMLTFRQNVFADDPSLWVSEATAGGQFMTFSQSTGQLVVVPEPSTLVIAGVGCVMTGWNVFRQHRRRVRARRPSFET